MGIQCVLVDKLNLVVVEQSAPHIEPPVQPTHYKKKKEATLTTRARDTRRVIVKRFGIRNVLGPNFLFPAFWRRLSSRVFIQRPNRALRLPTHWWVV